MESYILMVDIVYVLHMNLVKRQTTTSPTLSKIIQVFFAKVAQMFDFNYLIFQKQNETTTITTTTKTMNNSNSSNRKTFQNVFKLLQLEKTQHFNLRGCLLELVDVLL